ncbi:uncharacterized protein LOC126884577 isoform X1 [Diabrotica virgifera virgifera]|uniref:C2H2-type domain-containing protein n=2 Tax=Diabrotica virgifera virgifera TaxID=50390 RepID=A0ABM5K8K2_DIAVI|nr:uncharacterized protein LOC126884577 isoform X1 [Diabrotica virgifera virgifera]
MNRCTKCNINFSKPSNLTAHVKRKHPDMLDILLPKNVKQSKSTVPCLECNKKFANLGNLRVHVKRQHPDKLDEIAPVNKKTYVCSSCSESFYNLKKLVSHKQTHNNALTKLKCALCQYINSGRENLISHYRSDHFINTENNYLEFDTCEDFESWKCKVEEETFSSFVKMYGSKKTSNCTTTNYNCHRSGIYKKKGMNIRKLKIQGSNKINGYCPARINVKLMDNEKYIVNFCQTHVGHNPEQDLSHLFLSQSDKHNVAAKIAAKIPFQIILDEIRDSVSNSHLERLHLLKRKDLYNIEKCFNLCSSSVRHENDAISVDAWVNEMKSSECVLLYKPQETICQENPELQYEDFFLIIMTDGQKDLLLRFGEDCICIDGTHGLNAYGFELHTILVLDDLREGYPTAFLISNRSDFIGMKMFFQCIKERVGKAIKPKVFMSDMADFYYKSWKQVMQPAEFRLYCTWHVDKAWRKNLEKVLNKEKKVQVYHMLRTLLQETDSTAFNQLLLNFLKYLKEDSDTLEFAMYFEQYYACKAEQWAYCFRLHCTNLNTNMHIERMYRTIKHIYLHGKFVKRLDKAIGAIMKFVKDKLFERLIVIHKGKVSTKINELRKRHVTSQSLDLSKVIKSDNGWLVPSNSRNEMYTIQKVKENCPCRLVCEDCEACLHCYTCTCLDSCIKWNMCKHIHLICKYTQMDLTKESTIPNTNLLAGDADNLMIECDDENRALIDAVSKIKKDEESSLKEAKEKLILQLTGQINDLDSFEELKAVQKIVVRIKPTIDAIRNQKDINLDFPSTSRKYRKIKITLK